MSAMVDFALFHRAEQTPTRRGSGSAALCCYFGAIGPRIDAELLAEIGRRYRLRIVGPVRIPLPGLAPGSEVTGQVPYPQVPDHLRGVDVFVLPYHIDEYTAGITPAKIFECFATGNPVVSTYLPSLLPYEGLVYISRTHEGFLTNIDRALREPSRLREQRIQIARENSTEHWTNALSEWILSGLDEKDGSPG
jgi:glycosyltransferase involved in cell wall biosynthesis